DLGAAELRELGFLQIQAGITKLRGPILAAGLEEPDAQRFGDAVNEIEDPHARNKAMREFHVRLLATLTAADFRLGQAYGLGRALADATQQPPEWHAGMAAERVATVAGWTRELASVLPPHAARPVAQSVEAWGRWAQAQTGDGGETRLKLPAQ